MLTDPRLYPALLFLIGAGALAMAYTAQYGFGLEPCILCLYQRIPYAVVALLGAVGLAGPRWLVPVFALAVLTFAGGGVLAFYHVGVEQHWWASVAGCGGGPTPATVSAADLLATLQTKQPKACDEVDWTILGVSMAGWNVLFSTLYAGLCAYVLKARPWNQT